MTPDQQALIEDLRVRVARNTTRSSRTYRLEFAEGNETKGQQLWSVTTLLRALDKPALPYWAARETAAAAIRDREYLEADVARYGEDEAVKRLSGAPWSSRSRAGEIGTGVHELIDSHVRGAERPPVKEDLRDEIMPRFEQFLAWEREWAPIWHGAEMTVYNVPHGWAGTLDALAEIGTHGLGLIDVKCTNSGRDGQPGVYAEHGLQIACYAHAEVIVPVRGAWVEPVPMPQVEWGAVLWLAKDRHALVEVDVSDETYNAFRYAAQMWRWQDGPGKKVIGEVLEPSAFGVRPPGPLEWAED